MSVAGVFLIRITFIAIAADLARCAAFAAKLRLGRFRPFRAKDPDTRCPTYFAK